MGLGKRVQQALTGQAEQEPAGRCALPLFALPMCSLRPRTAARLKQERGVQVHTRSGIKSSRRGALCYG